MGEVGHDGTASLRDHRGTQGFPATSYLIWKIGRPGIKARTAPEEHTQLKSSMRKVEACSELWIGHVWDMGEVVPLMFLCQVGNGG